MLELRIERIGELAVVACEGRIVRSEAAVKLREAVTSLRNTRIIVLDVSEVRAIEGGGLGMLLFLQRWARSHDIQFKLFNPARSVRDRLELVNTAMFLSQTADEVSLLVRGSDLSKMSSYLSARLLANKKVRIGYNTEVVGVEGEEHRAHLRRTRPWVKRKCKSKQTVDTLNPQPA